MAGAWGIVDTSPFPDNPHHIVDRPEVALPCFAPPGLTKAKCPKVPARQLCVQMIRVIGVKVKKFVLNGCFDWLYGTKGPANGLRKSLDIKVLGRQFHDRCHKTMGLDTSQLPGCEASLPVPTSLDTPPLALRLTRREPGAADRKPPGHRRPS